MADIPVSHYSSSSLTTTGTLDTVALASTEFAAGGTYLVAFSGMLNNDVSGGRALAHLRWATTGEFPGGETEGYYAPVSAASTNGRAWGGYVVVTAPDPVEDLQVRLLRAASGTAGLRCCSIVSIRLDADLTVDTDYYTVVDNDDASPVALSTSYADFATLTKTFAAGNWLILPHWRIDSNTTTTYCYARLDYSGGGLTTGSFGESIQKGRSALERIKNIVQPLKVNLDGTSATFKIRCKQNSGTDFDHVSSRVTAINLDKFEEYTNELTLAGYTHTATATWEEVEAEPAFTPATDPGDWVVLGGILCDYGAATSYSALRIQHDGTTLNTATIPYIRNDSATETIPYLVPSLISAVGSTDLDLDSQVNHTSQSTEERSLVAFSVKLAAGGLTGIRNPINGPVKLRSPIGRR